MMLLLDIGNSRIKWALAADGALREHGAADHGGDPATWLREAQWPAVDAVWMASVMGATHEPALEDAIRSGGTRALRHARVQPEIEGLRLAYREPQRLGIDRFLMLLALWSERRRAFSVAAAGTALTFDAVDDQGRHAGGLIAAGLVTAQRALLDATRFPVQAAPASYAGGLGEDTESCVREGALHQSVGLLERMAARYPGPHVITGGDAPVLLPHLAGWQHRPLLILEGLYRYACSN